MAKTIGQNLDKYAIVITKSTVPVGTADKVKAELLLQLVRVGVLLPRVPLGSDQPQPGADVTGEVFGMPRVCAQSGKAV